MSQGKTSEDWQESRFRSKRQLRGWLTLRIEPVLKERLRKHAARKGEDFSETVRRAIKRLLEDERWE